MSSHRDGALRAHACIQGEGWFVETTRLDALTPFRALDVTKYGSSDVDVSPALSCPRCEQPMVRRFVVPAGVYVDFCDTHGVWLDRGELSSLTTPR